jgi:hypothetical protein
METLFGIFQAVTNKIPALVARILWEFFWYPGAPYARTRISYRILKGNQLDGVTLIVITYFMFAFVLGIPSTRHYILSFDNGLSYSIDQLRLIDTKGKEFIYLLVFVFILTVITLIVIEFIRRRYKYGNRDKREFFGMFSIFVSFTIGWFLVSSWLINRSWELISNWNTPPVPYLKNLASDWRAEVSALLKNNQVPDITGILLQPAFLLVIWMAWSFGHSVMRTWHSKRSAMSLVKLGKTGEAVGQLSVGYWPVLTITFLIVVSAVIMSAMAQLLFYNVRGDEEFSHTESCFQSDTKTELNFMITNNTTSEQVIRSLYFRIKTKRGRETYTKIIKIEPSALMWLSNKGVILENNERRYFRLQFPVQKLALDGDLVGCDLDAPNRTEPEGVLPLVDIEKADGDSYSNADGTNAPVR